MTAPADAVDGFVAYMGGLGSRWGLPQDACRLHAWLYLMGRPAAEAELVEALNLDAAAVAAATAFLLDYKMIARDAAGALSTGDDPWDMLTSGLAERRRREVGPALETLRGCYAASRDGADRGVSLRIGRLLTLAEDLAAIDAQASRVSPRLLKSLVGLSGRAARFAGRTLGRQKGETP